MILTSIYFCCWIIVENVWWFAMLGEEQYIPWAKHTIFSVTIGGFCDFFTNWIYRRYKLYGFENIVMFKIYYEWQITYMDTIYERQMTGIWWYVEINFCWEIWMLTDKVFIFFCWREVEIKMINQKFFLLNKKKWIKLKNLL